MYNAAVLMYKVMNLGIPVYLAPLFQKSHDTEKRESEREIQREREREREERERRERAFKNSTLCNKGGKMAFLAKMMIEHE